MLFLRFLEDDVLAERFAEFLELDLSQLRTPSTDNGQSSIRQPETVVQAESFNDRAHFRSSGISSQQFENRFDGEVDIQIFPTVKLL